MGGGTPAPSHQPIPIELAPCLMVYYALSFVEFLYFTFHFRFVFTMQIHDLNDYYRPRRFPWLPVLILVALVVFAFLHFRSKGDEAAQNTTEQSSSDSTATDQTAQGTVPSNPADSTAPTAAAPSTVASAPLPSPMSPTTTNAQEPPLSPAETEVALTQARQLEANGQLEEARNALLVLLQRAPQPTRASIQDSIGRLSIALFVSTRPAKGKITHTVRSGESLSKLAAKYNCPTLLIKKANGIQDAAKIKIGQSLVLLDHPNFAVQISKSHHTLALLLDNQFFKHYLIGTGTSPRSPVGTYKLLDKIAEPSWWPGDGSPAIPYGDPRNVLGTHWLSLEATGNTPRVSGYGIHGTWDESTLGKQIPVDGVRMRNEDVAEVFMLLPRGTPITIVE